jgi:hypothetical protein
MRMPGRRDGLWSGTLCHSTVSKAVTHPGFNLETTATTAETTHTAESGAETADAPETTDAAA